MTTQFIVRSHKQLSSLKTVIYPGIEIKRTKENNIAVFELTDPDLIVELVVKRKSSASATTTSTKADAPCKPGASLAKPAAKPNPAASAAAAESNPAAHPAPPAKKSAEWNTRFNELVAYKRKNGHTNVSPIENPELAIWVAQHAMHLNKKQHSQLHKETEDTNQMAKKKRASLKTPNRGSNKTDNDWNDRYTELVQYKRQHGNCFVKTSNSTDYPKLGAWVSLQRTVFNKGLLSQERIQKLNGIGFNWHANESKWNFHYALLMLYKQQYGHVMVPQSYFVSQNDGPPINLGNWAQTQRSDFKKGKITPDRVAKLNEIGFVWGIRNSVDWMQRYRELLEYRDQNGHCNVPQQYKPNKALGPWVDKQRQKFKKGVMSIKHQDLLNNIGFEWVRAKTPNRDYSKSKGQKEQNIECDHEEDEQFDDEGEGRGEAYNDSNELALHDAIRHSYPNMHPPPFYHDTSGNDQMYNRYWS